MKKCSKCGIQKPLSDFYKSNSKRGDGYQYACKPCNTIEKRKWRELNPDKNKNTKYKKKYGITLEQANIILQSQDNKCAICRSDLKTGSKTHLDHCHTTGKVRGFLCQKCNHGIGLFQDSIEKLNAAVKYLSHHEKQNG